MAQDVEASSSSGLINGGNTYRLLPVVSPQEARVVAFLSDE